MKYKNLQSIQNTLQKIITNDENGFSLESILKDKNPISIQERVKVYKDAYKIRLTESIKEDFLRVGRSLGEPLFSSKIEEFVYQNPSKYKNLAEYSGCFVEFLIKNETEENIVLGIKDWLEILCSRLSLDVNPIYDDLQDTNERKVVINPTVNSYFYKNRWLLGFKVMDNVTFLELNLKEKVVLDFFKEKKSENDILYYFENINDNSEDFLEFLTNGLRQGLLFYI